MVTYFANSVNLSAHIVGSCRLLVTTSSPKRRKVSPEPRSSPGEARRHGRSEPPPVPLPPRRHSTSNRRSKSASSSPPHYVPAHLQFPRSGTRSKSGVRSPTPATAYSGLTLSSEHSDMPSDHRDGTPPATSEGRSPSPGVKRPASEIADSDPEGGVSTAVNNDTHLSENNGGAQDNGVYPTPSSMDTYTASTATREHSKAESAESDDIPSIDEQVAQVTAAMNQPLQDGDKGYVISMAWLKKVLVRSSSHADQVEKEFLESDLGPMDNTDIVLDTDPTTSGFKDEAGEPFVPMRPGLQLGEDYDIVPQQGWDLIMKWYGLADPSPIILRYARNTNPSGDIPNVIYELNPPIFTIFKLINPAKGTTPKVLKEKNMPAAKALASRQMNFQKWLKNAKQLGGIDMSTKVRVWKVLGGLRSANASATATPAVSRSTSPAPAAALIPSANDKLLVDLNTFTSLSEGSQRVLVDGVKDQTANENYNGRMTLDMAGLAGTDVVILEEQAGGSKGGNWISEASAQTLKRLGIAEQQSKEVTAPTVAKSPMASGRSTPVKELPQEKKRQTLGLAITGMENMGNTCYQNAATQCNSYVAELNPENLLAYHGQIAKAYAGLLRAIFRDPTPSSISPANFRRTIGKYNSAMSGFEQHDSQEFLMFLLDGLSEDLNRIRDKPYIEKPDSTDEMVHNRAALEEFGVKSWDMYKARNDSVITDLFAGMYKSTLVCPKCDKVSIIFDPFSTLTLQIPVPQYFSREVVYMPLNGEPVKVGVELDHMPTLEGWKLAVAKKVNTDADRVIAAEVHKHSFWRVFDSDEEKRSVNKLHVASHDLVVFIEVDVVPPSPERHDTPTLKSPETDRIIVPIFHRKIDQNRNTGFSRRENFLVPSLIVLTRDEAQDYETIYRKLLRHVATMTTRDIFNDKLISDDVAEGGLEDSDTVVMNEDDAKSADSRIKTSSVEGEDSLVDISMHDTSQLGEASSPATEATSKLAESTGHLPGIAHGLQRLFDVKVAQSSEPVPLGRQLNPSKNTHSCPLASRLHPPRLSSTNDISDEYSDTDGSDNEPNTSGSNSDVWSLISFGEAILLDWNDEARDALFGRRGNNTNDPRGEFTFSKANGIVDPELIRQRRIREQNQARGVPLDNCLTEFSKEEILSETDAWYCPRCKEHRQARKKFDLWKTPDILVVHLKRFGAQTRFSRLKLDTKVNFPIEGLDLSGRVQGPHDDKGFVYDLIGVDCHVGSMSGGHYTAYAKNFRTGKWCSYNGMYLRCSSEIELNITNSRPDSRAAELNNPAVVVSPTAYLLFYRRRSSRPLGGPKLEKIAASFKDPAANDDSMNESRGQSPSGEVKPSEDENTDSGPGSEQEEGMHNAEGEDLWLESDDPFHLFQDPSWSFDPVPEAHDLEQMINRSPVSSSNGGFDDLFGETDSTLAVSDMEEMEETSRENLGEDEEVVSV
ncbi:hypothetical protein NUU61_008482 [Penicillium alfredii]|uniref:ubiquitinyl hydrolase 1 n=1 Tax=Penicillium alfredii TaxID=1506179 RepID=A0A9W9EL96_9EURO|nr:uncharacterized protein NUU61_008482 [Penicillium alfredii]KAJ5083903.1 hypothetical protein NUU61_008482 [Penicillium alfredii]